MKNSSEPSWLYFAPDWLKGVITSLIKQNHCCYNKPLQLYISMDIP